MLTKPIPTAPVARGPLGAPSSTAGADQSFYWPYPFPSEGADQAWVGLWCFGAPSEGVDQSMMWHLPPSEGVDA